jgi:hypothetical protein
MDGLREKEREKWGRWEVGGDRRGQHRTRGQCPHDANWDQIWSSFASPADREDILGRAVGGSFC